MKQNSSYALPDFKIYCLIAALLLALGCSKEKALEPTNISKNYFVVEDNPNDPVDHAIYEFYKKTGIAGFCNDTIYKKRISADNEMPERFSYIRLSFNYHPLADPVQAPAQKPLSNRNAIPGLLQLLQNEVVPKLPGPWSIPSILFLDSVSDNFNIVDIQLKQGWEAIQGFNTLGVAVKDVDLMSTEERKLYAASILAGIAAKRITDLYGHRIQTEFYSITREAGKQKLPLDIYIGFPFSLFFPPSMLSFTPESIGVLFYAKFFMEGVTATPMDNMPRESDDLRAYLAATFSYDSQEFTALYQQEPLVLQKYNIIRAYLKEAGFKMPN